jgi:hypothetical protein
MQVVAVIPTDRFGGRACFENAPILRQDTLLPVTAKARPIG